MTIRKTTRSDNSNLRVNKSFVLKPLATAILTGFSAFALPAYAVDEVLGLGLLPGGTYSSVNGISADGTVVVGTGSSTNGNQAFVWSGGTMIGLGGLASHIAREDATHKTRSYGHAASANGSIVVGASSLEYSAAGAPPIGTAFAQSEAFKWQSGSMTGLGFLQSGHDNSFAYGVSADGSVIVGTSGAGVDSPQAVKWTNGAIAGLSFLSGYTASRANGVSADGTVVVGYVFAPFSATGSQAALWSGNTVTGLGFLSGGTSSSASAISADGTVVVGSSSGSGVSQAFRWTGGVMTGLGFLPTKTSSDAKAVSADGSVVVGTSGGTAFRWTQTAGMDSVANWLSTASVTVPTGLVLSVASGVSADGNVVVGTGSQSWLARVVPGTPTPAPTPAPAPAPTPTPTPAPAPAPAPAPVTSGFIPDLVTFNGGLLESGSQGVQVGVVVPSLALFGAHHRSLLDNGMVRKNDSDTCSWATADAAKDNQTGTKMSLIEAGVCKDFGALRIGAGVGHNQAEQTWANGGNAKFSGEHLILEAAQQFTNGIEGSLLGYYGSFNTELNRKYLNGINIDSSTAKPKAASVALRARVEMKDVVKQGNVSISPYAAYTYTKTKLEAYMENGGGFPAQYDAATFKSNDLRVGANLKMSINPATDLKVGVELAHRFEKNTTGVNGKVIGLYDFSLAGEKVKQDWARVLIDIDHRLSEDAVLTFGANAATKGGDASWGVTAGLRIRF